MFCLCRVGCLFVVTNWIILDHKRYFGMRGKLNAAENLSVFDPLLRICEYFQAEFLIVVNRTLAEPAVAYTYGKIKREYLFAGYKILACVDSCPVRIHNAKGQRRRVFTFGQKLIFNIESLIFIIAIICPCRVRGSIGIQNFCYPAIDF